jgi:hypothetical protein
VSARYEVLHFPGDLTDHPQAQPGQILGSDEMTRPYEVLDAEFLQCFTCHGRGWVDTGDARVDCGACSGCGGVTAVHLQYATPENITGYLTQFSPEILERARAGGEVR